MKERRFIEPFVERSMLVVGFSMVILPSAPVNGVQGGLFHPSPPHCRVALLYGEQRIRSAKARFAIHHSFTWFAAAPPFTIWSSSKSRRARFFPRGDCRARNDPHELREETSVPVQQP